jgi:hypothetical protein
MEIKIRTYYWNTNKTKILGQSKTVLTDTDICELINSKFIEGDYGIPIHLNKEDIIFESDIDEIKIN